MKYAEQALTGPGASPQSDFFVTMVLAAGQLGSGDVDRACDTVRQAVELGAAVKSARAIEYLRQFRKNLATYNDSDVVIGLATDLRENPLWQAAG